MDSMCPGSMQQVLFRMKAQCIRNFAELVYVQRRKWGGGGRGLKIGGVNEERGAYM